MERRSLYFGSLVLGLIALALVACAPTAPAPPAAEKPAVKEEKPAEKPAAKVAEVKYGGVARFGTIGKPGNAHPYAPGSATGAGLLTLSGTIWDTLIEFDYTVEEFRMDLPLVPMLAESWKQENPTSYLFTVRQGVKWHDGKTLTVEDVIWSMEYMRDPKEPFAGRSRLAGVDKIEKVDNTSFRMTLKAPNPQILIQLAGALTDPMPMLPKHVYDEGGTELLKTKAIGTGPFKMVKFDPAGVTVMAKNENYWRKDAQGKSLPRVDGIEFIHGMDRATNEAAFAAQEVDLVHFQTKKQLDAIKAGYPDFDVAYHNAGHGSGLVFNVAKGPFKDIRLRKAAFLAVDWHELNAAVLDGYGKMSGPVVPGLKKGWGFSEEELLKMPGYRKDKTEDLAEAKRLLAEAGYPTGIKVNMIYDRAFGSAFMGEFMPVPLKKAGFDVEALGQDAATVTKNMQDGNFDMVWWNIANERPLIGMGRWFESKGVYAKGAGINDPELDKLIEQLRQAPTKDEEKRLVRAQAEYLNKVYYARNLGDPAYFRGTQKWFKDYLSYYSAQAAPGGGAYQFWLDLDKMPAKRKR